MIASLFVVISTTASATSVLDPNEELAVTRDIKRARLDRGEDTFAWKSVTWDAFEDSTVYPWGFKLDMDSKSGPGADYVVRIFYIEVIGSLECFVERPSGSEVADGVVIRPDQRTVICTFPRSVINRDKTIRWRALSEQTGSLYTDKAPDSGWLVGV